MLGSNIHIDMSGLEKFAKKVDSISGQRKVHWKEMLSSAGAEYYKEQLGL